MQYVFVSYCWALSSVQLFNTFSFYYRISEAVEECSSGLHRWRENRRVLKETRHLLHARDRTKEKGHFPFSLHTSTLCSSLSVLNLFVSFVQMPVQKRKKQSGQRKKQFKTHNNHLAGVLEDYTDGVPGKKWNKLAQIWNSEMGVTGHTRTDCCV